jgi:signal transduction histidine kinase/CheY-like chemotaxis protein
LFDTKYKLLYVCCRDGSLNHFCLNTKAISISMNQEGVSSLFQKIVNESSEMVFLAESGYPYSILYANESFEKNLGTTLKDRSLTGLNVNFHTDLIRGELKIVHQQKSFIFHCDSVADSDIRRILFYGGKESEDDAVHLAVTEAGIISDAAATALKKDTCGNAIKSLLENVPAALFRLTIDAADGQIHSPFFSEGFQSILGLSQATLREITNFSDLLPMVHPQDLPQVVNSASKAASSLQIWRCQFRLLAGKERQSYRWVSIAARPQTLGVGEMIWYGAISDISIQKEVDAKLEEARFAAEKANRVKSDFLSMISHELRTPLNAISGSVYSLFLEDPTETQKSALNTINFAVDNLLNMINDLLDFQKVEAGKLTLEDQSLNLSELMVQVIKGLSFHAKDTKNALQLHLSDGLDSLVRGDKTRLTQVMNNLITNALKFTKQGKVEVSVGVVSQSSEKVRVHFSVSDTGIGIAPEHKQQIFNDFDQVRPSFHSKYGGTGLGLPITKRLLELMGGKIAVDSELGKGSRFYFDLEFDKVQHKPVNVDPLPSYDITEHHHLLIAEDNEVNSLVLGKIIRKWGYTFHRVSNGQEAVRAAQSSRFDCILMDIQMPGMDGLTAAQEIKKFSDTPIIALTASAELDLLERVDHWVFDGFVAKPIDPSILQQKVIESFKEKI